MCTIASIYRFGQVERQCANRCCLHGRLTASGILQQVYQTMKYNERVEIYDTRKSWYRAGSNNKLDGITSVVSFEQI